jgi:hypothetical protein
LVPMRTAPVRSALNRLTRVKSAPLKLVPVSQVRVFHVAVTIGGIKCEGSSLSCGPRSVPVFVRTMGRIELMAGACPRALLREVVIPPASCRGGGVRGFYEDTTRRGITVNGDQPSASTRLGISCRRHRPLDISTQNPECTSRRCRRATALTSATVQSPSSGGRHAP